MVTENINIDVRPGGIPIVIHVTQYEAGLRQFVFTPYTSNGTQTIVAGSATLEGTKPDGYAFQQACQMIDGVITYTLQEQLCAVEGRVWSRLVIRDTDGGMIGYTAIVWVVGCAGVKDDAVMSDSDISALRQFLDEFGDIDAYRGALNGALAAVGGPLVAATASAMTDTTKVYVYTGSESGYTEGHWYYWNGSAWTDGGVYQSTGINTDKTLTVEDMAADAKATGDAVAELKNDLGVHSGIISANLMGIDVQENLYLGAADWSGEWVASDAPHMLSSDETLNGYPVMESSVSWNRYFRLIPIEAGKTYAFEGWIRHSTAGAASIFVTWANHVDNAATVSVNSKQFNNVPANTWTKLSLTFDCTESGNIGPFVLSTTGAFEFAKYTLVEGTEVFSLDNALDGKASIGSVSGIGDYLRYNFSIGASTGAYWNHIIDKEITAGTKVKLIFDYYSGEYLSYVRIDGKKTDNTWQNHLCRISAPVHGGEAEFTAAEKYVALRVQLARSQDESNVTAAIYIATNSELGITNELMGMQSQRVFHVEKNGTGDFTSLVEAINTACQYLDSIVYVGTGEWNIIDEFGAAYMEAVSSNNSTWGLWLKNRIHLIGTAKTVIKAVNATGSTNFENIKEYFSVFNAGEKGFTLENINIEDENIRYSVHDDRGSFGSEPYTNKYIRCSMIHKNGKYPDCIGAGLGENQTVEIRGCYFEGDLGRPRLVYWHGNNGSGVTDALGKLTVCDNYFAQDGTFKLTRYGQSDTDTVAYVSNNSFGTAPSVDSGSTAPYDNMRMVMWNNEVRTA